MLTPLLLLSAFFPIFLFQDPGGPTILLYQIYPKSSTNKVKLYCLPKAHQKCSKTCTTLQDCQYTITDIGIIKDSTTVATIHQNSFAKKMIPDENVGVSGQLTGHLEHFPYLSLDWSNRMFNFNSSYTCSVRILFPDGEIGEGFSDNALWAVNNDDDTYLHALGELETSVLKLKHENNILRQRIQESEKEVNLIMNSVHVEQGFELYEMVGSSDTDNRYITFNVRYQDLPVVTTSIVQLDVSTASVYGLEVKLSGVSTTGFHLLVKAAIGSFVNLLEVHWISIYL